LIPQHRQHQSLAFKPYLNQMDLVFSDFCDSFATAQHRLCKTPGERREHIFG
jgi:hypothetical protein